MGLVKILKRPFYTELSAFYWLKMSLAFGLFVFLFLFLFRPFQIENIEGNFLLVCATFGAITAASMLFIDILILPLVANKIGTENWTVGYSILWTLLHIAIIAFFNSIYFSFTFLDGFNFGNLMWFLGVTLLVSIFPVSLAFILQERNENRKIIKASEEISSHLKTGGSDKSTDEQLINIRSKNANEDLQIPLAHFFFMQAADNYITVYFKNENESQKTIIRNTLSGVAEELKDLPGIFYCHRSYLVNLEKVISVSGNAQGFKLKIHHFNEEIPVSRKHNKFIKEYFAVRH